MMKTILVPAGGGNADAPVFDTALVVARPLAAHLEFVHVHLAAGDAAAHTPHMEFARGAAIAKALDTLAGKAAQRAAAARQNVQDFCARNRIEMFEAPHAAAGVTARWRQDDGEPMERLAFHARHHDLVVMARPTQLDGLPPDRLETLLLSCGRPLLITPPTVPMRALGTVMVCWKETSEAARALSAAMPLLAKAKRVVIACVEEAGAGALTEAIGEVIRELAWNGIAAEPQVLPRKGRSTAETLFAAARGLDADLMVMGAYGHRYLREALFGGCTQSAIDSAECPVFLVH
jgi:nucleotide-binding universal stress UspA family protein